MVSDDGPEVPASVCSWGPGARARLAPSASCPMSTCAVINLYHFSRSSDFWAPPQQQIVSALGQAQTNRPPVSLELNCSPCCAQTPTVKLKWIREPPAEVQLRAGKSLQLECDASGQPEPLISWTSLKGESPQLDTRRLSGGPTQIGAKRNEIEA